MKKKDSVFVPIIITLSIVIPIAVAALMIFSNYLHINSESDYSFLPLFHAILIFITAMSLPFLAKKPLDIPPVVSVELIQITEKTNIPFAPKAKKIIEKVKEKEKKLI